MARGFNYAPGASAEVHEAAQPGLAKARIAELGASRNALVRATVAARPDCPLGLMVSLAHDYHADVRSAVARNPIAQRTVMAYLSADRSVEVVKALLANPSLPSEILDELAFHKKQEVRSVAAARLDAGAPAALAVPVEDVHTPELAEHVLPAFARTADGMPGPHFEPGIVVDFATRAPLQAIPTLEPEQGPEPAAASDDWRVPQIFSPHSQDHAPAPTRTAPIRGFKVRE